MKMVAAARLRRAEARAQSARPYADRLQSFLDGFTIDPENIPHPLAEVRGTVRRKGLLLFTSDRGLCGSFNTHLIKKVEEWLKDKDPETVRLYIVGRKGNNYFKRRKWKINKSFTDIDQALDYKQIKGITETVSNDFINGEIDELDIIYSQFVTAAVCRQIDKQLLPIRSEITKENDEGPAADFIFEPSPEAILEILFPKYLYTRVVTALAENIASEQGQRMVAMTTATDNAEEMVKNLTLVYNKVRQASITREITEIVGGAEALEK